MHDTINRDGLLRLTTVQNGRIVVNGSLSYRALVLRAAEPFLTPKVAAKIKELVEAGAVGGRSQADLLAQPGTRGCGTGGGQAGRRAIVGQPGRQTATENRVGKGRVFWGKPLKDVLAALGVSPDVEFTKLVETATGKPVVVNMSSPGGTNPVLVGAERKGWGMEYLHKQAGATTSTS